MVLTESVDIHANHIGAIKINKDRLMEEYNVFIKVMRGERDPNLKEKRQGGYHKVEISGYNKDIRNVIKRLNEIVDIAILEYNEYRRRKQDRQRAFRQKFNTFDSEQTNSMIKHIKIKKKPSNPFDVLAIDEDLNQNNEYDNKFPELQNICASSNSKVSWGDMIDDE